MSHSSIRGGVDGGSEQEPEREYSHLVYQVCRGCSVMCSCTVNYSIIDTGHQATGTVGAGKRSEFPRRIGHNTRGGQKSDGAAKGTKAPNDQKATASKAVFKLVNSRYEVAVILAVTNSRAAADPARRDAE